MRGAQEVLARHSPLIFYEFKHGENINAALLTELTKAGYKSYRLLASLNVLLPVEKVDSLDAYQLNLIACKNEEATNLAQANVLITGSADPANILEWDDDELIERYNAFFPADTLAHLEIKKPGWQTYRQAICCYLLFNDQTIPKAIRYGYLLQSRQLLEQSCDEMLCMERICSLAAVLLALGERALAMTRVEQAIMLMQQNSQRFSSEIFIPPEEKCLHHERTPDRRFWIKDLLLECYVVQKTFSSYFAGKDTIDMILSLRKTGLADDKVERMMALMLLRTNKLCDPERVIKADFPTEQTLNRKLWQKIPVKNEI